MNIRKAKPKDAKPCLNLSKEKYWQKQDFIRSVKDKDVVFLVAEIDKQVVGYILGFIVPTNRREAMIHETRVHTKHRRKGIGKALVNALCKALFNKKVKHIYAEIEPKHMKFYKGACKFKNSGKWIEVVKSKPKLL